MAGIGENSHSGGLLVFALNTNKDLATKIARLLGIHLTEVTVGKFQNKETKVSISVSVRGRDVFIIQSGQGEDVNVNDALMELFIMAYACKTSCARRIVGVIPYLPYSKQSKMNKRGSIPSKLVASMMCKSGLSGLITMDLRSKEIQGFYDVPVDNLRASPFMIQYITEQVPDFRNAVIVARNPASAIRATSFAERLRLGIAVIHGEPKEADSEVRDGRHSPPPASTDARTFSFNLTTMATGPLDVPGSIPKAKPPMNVVGDVGGKIAIIVDDMIDNAESFAEAARLLKQRGAYKICVMVTHGLLSANAPELITNSDIDEVVVTNTVAHKTKISRCPKIKTIDISPLLAEAIRRIHNGESMGYLFRNVPLED